MIRLIDDYVLFFDGPDCYTICRIINNDSDTLSFVDVTSFDDLHKAIEFARLYIAARMLSGEEYVSEDIRSLRAFLDELDKRVVD